MAEGEGEASAHRPVHEGGSVIAFEKWQGAGNDFVIVDGRDASVPIDMGARVRLAVASCDRHFGIGADGLLIADHAPGGTITMVMFNPDGSLSEMCGNGLRCFADWLFDQGTLERGQCHEIVTGAGALSVARSSEGDIRVGMGLPRLDASVIPVVGGTVQPDGWSTVLVPDGAGGTLRATCVSMGNPHAVIFVPDVAAVPLSSLGPVLERHGSFPQRANIEFASIRSRRAISMVVWERGAGATLACGTGACAVVVAARLHDLVDPVVAVHLPGGTLSVEWHGTSARHALPVYLGGPSRRVFRGHYDFVDTDTDA